MLLQDVRLSVRLSITRQCSVETIKRILGLFSPSGSHTIPVFPHQTVWQYSDGAPVTGESNARNLKKYKKNSDFRLSRFISEMLQDRAIVSYRMRIGNCTQAFEWHQF